MAENQGLERFLSASTSIEDQSTPEPAPSPEPPPAAAPAPAPATPSPASPTPPPEADDLEALAGDTQGEDGRMVSFRALEKVRNDWRGKYIAEQTRAQMLQRELEEARRAPPAAAAPPPAPPQPPPDPRTDPEGYNEWRLQEDRKERINDRLNQSEYLMRQQHGDEVVTDLQNEFRAMAQRDPSLWQRLHNHPMPYHWLKTEVDRVRASRDIGDPVTYRERIVAEERAKWEAERAAAPAPVSPAAGLPPSLANARSAGGRAAPAWTGETTDGALVAQIRQARVNRGRR